MSLDTHGNPKTSNYRNIEKTISNVDENVDPGLEQA